MAGDRTQSSNEALANLTERRVSVSIKEAASLVGIKKDLIYRAINSGELPSIKIGRRRLINLKSLEAWITNLEHQTHREMGFDSYPLPTRQQK
jgi:excisionase family DNA binding protein